MGYESPYMNGVAPVREPWRDALPAVVHVDGSARVQTVGGDDPRYLALHRRVEELAGIAVLLNTSFNRRGMPIVETPAEALDLFLETALDALVLDDLLVEKVGSPAGRGGTDGYAATVEALRERVEALPAGHGGPCVNLEVTGLEDSLVLRLASRRLEEGSAPHPDVTLRCSARTLAALVSGAKGFEAALEAGLLEAVGMREEEAPTWVASLRPLFRAAPATELSGDGREGSLARAR
jgi:carbamoyltransferase